MARWSDSTDRRPGVLPDIRVEGDHLVFEFAIAVGPREERPLRFILRCQSNGDLLASIEQPNAKS